MYAWLLYQESFVDSAQIKMPLITLPVMINQFMNILFKLIVQVGYLKQVTEYIDQFKYQLLDQ